MPNIDSPLYPPRDYPGNTEDEPMAPPSSPICLPQKDAPNSTRSRLASLEERMNALFTQVTELQFTLDQHLGQTLSDVVQNTAQNRQNTIDAAQNAPGFTAHPSIKPGELKPWPMIVPGGKVRIRAVKTHTCASGLRRMLISLAQRPGLSARQIGVRAGLSSSSGSFNTYLSTARSKGWIEGDKHSMTITKAGLKEIGHYDPLPEGKALLSYWCRQLGGGMARMLQHLCDYPKEGTARQSLGMAANLSHTSGSFNTYLSRLRTLELIETRNGRLYPSPELL